METLAGYWQIYLSSPVAFSLLLTAKVCAAALLLQTLTGVPLAWYLSGRGGVLRGLVENVITFPLIFPPIASGYLLLVILGRFSPIGSFLKGCCGVEIVFSFPGVVLAAYVAGLPLVVKPIQSAIQALGKDLVEASYTLGRGRSETFLRVVIPVIRRSVIAALVLGLGRSLGEVGITLMLGGNIIGKTNTLSLEVFNAVYDGDFDRAAALCLLLFLCSMILFTLMRRLNRRGCC
jgi:molybdate transport system permease protein